MKTTEQSRNDTEAQNAFQRIALALDSFLLNGIPMGIVYKSRSDDLLQVLTTKYDDALAALEQLIAKTPKYLNSNTTNLVAQARRSFRELQDCVEQLEAFRGLSYSEIQSAVSAVVQVRQDCVKTLQQLESSLSVAQSIYESRSAVSQTNVDKFLANLVVLLESERPVRESAPEEH